VEFTSDEVLDLSSSGSVDIGEPADVGIGDRPVGLDVAGNPTLRELLYLANNEGKRKYEVVVVAELEQKGGPKTRARQLGVLPERPVSTCERGGGEGIAMRCAPGQTR